jgi:DNA mismatch repair ATPase MutS
MSKREFFAHSLLASECLIKTFEQAIMAKIILEKESVRRTNEWISLVGITNEYGLPYHKTMRFIMKLVRHGYAETRARQISPHVKRKPFDFALTKNGKCKLTAELQNLKDEISSL